MEKLQRSKKEKNNNRSKRIKIYHSHEKLNVCTSNWINRVTYFHECLKITTTKKQNKSRNTHNESDGQLI